MAVEHGILRGVAHHVAPGQSHGEVGVRVAGLALAPFHKSGGVGLLQGCELLCVFHRTGIGAVNYLHELFAESHRRVVSDLFRIGAAELLIGSEYGIAEEGIQVDLPDSETFRGVLPVVAYEGLRHLAVHLDAVVLVEALHHLQGTAYGRQAVAAAFQCAIVEIVPIDCGLGYFDLIEGLVGEGEGLPGGLLLLNAGGDIGSDAAVFPGS